MVLTVFPFKINELMRTLCLLLKATLDICQYDQYNNIAVTLELKEKGRKNERQKLKVSIDVTVERAQISHSLCIRES